MIVCCWVFCRGSTFLSVNPALRPESRWKIRLVSIVIERFSSLKREVMRFLKVGPLVLLTTARPSSLYRPMDALLTRADSLLRR